MATQLRGRLLVVDDNELNRRILSGRLAAEGHTVSVAEGGRQALAMITADEFDLVLLDVMMPDLSGYDVLQHLKADDALRHIPVIMISALQEMESVVKCIELGAEDYLFKPFEPVLLRARIGASLEKKWLRDQELAYLRDVTRLTAAAASVEAEEFVPETLAQVTQRSDELGQLARVFQRMALEVAARHARLEQEIQLLRIEIDEGKKARQVAEITETEYFQQLRKKARDLRDRVEMLPE